MGTVESRTLKGIVAVVAVAVVMAAVGVAVSAQMGPRRGMDTGQSPAGPGGAGMMGPGPGMRGGGPGGGPFGMMGPELRMLDLTDAQRQQVRAAFDAHKDELKAIGDRMQTARKALQDAIAADAFDETAIRAKAADVALVDADAAVLRAKMHAAVIAVLTPEQQQKAKELRGQMENRMKGGRERMRQHMEQRFEPRSEQPPSEPETV
jgi:Spy/CpxP family protein refolding chaperone